MSEDVQRPENSSEQDPALEPTPRTVDVATWVARGIVVLTLALVAVVGGLVLGLSVTDPTSATARPAATTSTPASSPPTADPTTESTFVRGPTAPPVRISAATPDGVAGTTAPHATASEQTSRPSAPQPTATAAPTSSTSTPATRGNSTNTAKPKPTKTR